jgi:hypothetical protein
MRLLCLLGFHKLKYSSVGSVDKCWCERCHKEFYYRAAVRDIVFKCISTCPTCHGKY